MTIVGRLQQVIRAAATSRSSTSSPRMMVSMEPGRTPRARNAQWAYLNLASREHGGMSQIATQLRHSQQQAAASSVRQRPASQGAPCLRSLEWTTARTKREALQVPHFRSHPVVKSRRRGNISRVPRLRNRHLMWPQLASRAKNHPKYRG
jgi:hypothetical protein